MSNVLGVWSTAAGMWLLAWGASGSLRIASAVAGLVLAAAALALLIDVDNRQDDA